MSFSASATVLKLQLPLHLLLQLCLSSGKQLLSFDFRQALSGQDITDIDRTCVQRTRGMSYFNHTGIKRFSKTFKWLR